MHKININLNDYIQGNASLLTGLLHVQAFDLPQIYKDKGAN